MARDEYRKPSGVRENGLTPAVGYAGMAPCSGLSDKLARRPALTAAAPRIARGRRPPGIRITVTVE